MPKIRGRGHIRIPHEIRDRSGFLRGTDLNAVSQENKAVVVKRGEENRVLKWLGQGKGGKKRDIGHIIDQLRVRISG